MEISVEVSQKNKEGLKILPIGDPRVLACCLTIILSLRTHAVYVRSKGDRISVAKLKSIKKFDDNGRNADKALVQIRHERYNLEKPTGVDYQVFYKNRISQKPLKVNDKDVFPEGKERFKLGSHDLHNVLEHTGRLLKQKKKR